MLKKNIFKMVTACTVVNIMNLYVESSSYDDFYTATLDKRSISQLESTNLFEENLSIKRPRFKQKINAFLLLDILINKYAYDLETKDSRRRRNIEARREYLNKVNFNYIKRNNNSTINQQNSSLAQRVFDEKPVSVYDSIPSPYFENMLIEVFSFMEENNYYDENFKDSNGRDYQYYLG